MNKSLQKIQSIKTFILSSEDFLIQIILQNPQKNVLNKVCDISRAFVVNF
jgi:hypothetical protein